MTAVFERLRSRGLVEQFSSDELARKLDAERLTVYTGFDPTADSLHLGNLVPIMVLAHLQRAGHRVLPLVGGATGMIGDPSGKSEERSLLSPEEVDKNLEGQKRQLARFLDFEGPNAAKIVNNADWIGKILFIDWLRDVGKHFTVNYMLAKDSVRSRIGSDSGISYTEFSYMTMQAYDFLHLFDAEGCTLQCGGNDQWGNITAGIDLIRKLRGAQAFGMTSPLVTTSSGEKFGKTAGNAVWLDPERTSPYQFYQYWINVDDRDVVRYLNYFTFLDPDEIASFEEAVETDPEKRTAQKRLALEVTRLVHGDGAAEKAKRESEAMFGGSIMELSAEERRKVLGEGTHVSAPAHLFDDPGTPLPVFLREIGAYQSSTSATAGIRQGAVRVNDERTDDPGYRIGKKDLVRGGGSVYIRVGKKKRLNVEPEQE